jgi:hypothetical protein
VVARLNREVNRALADPVLSVRPAALAATLRADVARWPALVRAAGARPD